MCPPGTIDKVRAACSHSSDHSHVDRRALLATGAAAALASLLPGEAAHAAEAAHHNGRLLDLTYVFGPTFPIATGPAPTRDTIFTIENDGFYAQRWSFWEHTATHLDVPGHFIPGGRLVPQMDPAELMFVPAIVIDISDRAARNPDSQVEIDDLLRYEHRYGRIPHRALVIMHSGWQSRVNDPDAFLGRDATGNLHFPGFGARAAEFLLERRAISGVAVDTISIDATAHADAPVHHMVLGANLFALENLANVARLPRRGATLFIGVVPWEQGSGGPCRVVAQI